MRPIKEITVYSTIVTNDQGQVLLVQRHEPELPPVHGLWELPAGKKKRRESPEGTVARETLEETGYSIEVHRQLSQAFSNDWQYPNFDQHTLIICYLSSLLPIPPVVAHDHHVSEVRWVDVKDITTYQLLPGVLFFLQQSGKLKND